MFGDEATDEEDEPFEDESSSMEEEENSSDESERNSSQRIDDVIVDEQDPLRIIRELKRATAKKEVQKALIKQVHMMACPQYFFSSYQEFCDIGPYFEFPNFRSFDNVDFDDEFGLVPSEDPSYVSVRLGDARTRATYMRMITVLKKIFTNLRDNLKTTKRALYYNLLGEEGPGFTYEQVSNTIEMIVAMLQIPRGDLGILGTSKGLILGNITLRMINGETFDCRDLGLVPNDVDDIANIDIDLRGHGLVIVVEKDAVFHRLMGDDFLNFVRVNSLVDGVPQIDPIMITAKGYPDLATRKLLRRLATKDLPNAQFYALVDGDPHGYEIFTTYKYGSVAMAWCAEPLAILNLEWLGVKPSEFEDLSDHHKRPLTNADQAKLDSLNDRGIFSEEHEEELRIMDDLKLKVEIEDLPCVSEYLWKKFEDLVDQVTQDSDRSEE